MTNARGIQDPYGAIALGAALLGIERVVGRTAHCAIRLWSKRGAGKAMGKRWPGPLRWAVYDRRCWCDLWGWRIGRGRFGVARGSKFGGAQLGWRELLAQLQPDIPRPLSEDLGELLATGGMGVPAIHVLLDVFIGQHRFKRPTMQVQIENIRG